SRRPGSDPGGAAWRWAPGAAASHAGWPSGSPRAAPCWPPISNRSASRPPKGWRCAGTTSSATRCRRPPTTWCTPGWCCCTWPGGVLQLDEFDIGYGPALLMPAPRARRLYEEFLEAKIRVMSGAGADPAWGRNAPEAMRRAGLVEVDPRPRVELWDASSPGVHL